MYLGACWINETAAGLLDDDLALNGTQRFQWQTSVWSRCNSGCGEPVRTRAVKCANVVTGDCVNEEECLQTTAKPATTQSCSDWKDSSRFLMMNLEETGQHVLDILAPFEGSLSAQSTKSECKLRRVEPG